MSRLTDTLYLLYAYQQADTDKLARKLTERMRATWINTLTDLARQHGCGQYAGTPKGQDAKELARLSKQDAQSIANTFNRDVRRQIERLYAANPRGNRTYYISNLERWAAARDVWKSYQIGLETDGKARRYATQRFYAMNEQLANRFAAYGPPAVCEICMRIFAAGVVDFAYTQLHPLPAHFQCPHTYKAVAPAKLECSKMWLG